MRPEKPERFAPCSGALEATETADMFRKVEGLNRADFRKAVREARLAYSSPPNPGRLHSGSRSSGRRSGWKKAEVQNVGTEPQTR